LRQRPIRPPASIFSLKGDFGSPIPPELIPIRLEQDWNRSDENVASERNRPYYVGQNLHCRFEAKVNELLSKILEAHGGMNRWRGYEKVEATIVSGPDDGVAAP
jgi:hypothetical protein